MSFRFNFGSNVPCNCREPVGDGEAGEEGKAGGVGPAHRLHPPPHGPQAPRSAHTVTLNIQAVSLITVCFLKAHFYLTTVGVVRNHKLSVAHKSMKAMYGKAASASAPTPVW